MRILLVQPAYDPAQMLARMNLLEPLALEILAAYCAADDEVRLIDLRLEPPGTLEATLERFQPDLVAITCLTTTQTYPVQQLGRLVRDRMPGVLVAVGGHHASLMPQDFVPESADVVLRGEAEVTWSPLLTALKSGADWHNGPGVCYSEDGRLISGNGSGLLDSLAGVRPPDRSLTAPYRQCYFHFHYRPTALVAAGRGCPFRCTFCSVSTFYEGRYRLREPGDVVCELAGIEAEHVAVADDNFLDHVEWSWQLARAISAAGLKKTFGVQARSTTIARHPDLIAAWRAIGLSEALVGFEFVSTRDLAKINKRATAGDNERAIEVLHSNDVAIWGAFIVEPEFGADDFARLEAYVAEQDIDFPQYTVLTPLPGTVLWQERRGDLITHDRRLFDTLHCVLPSRLPLDKFYEYLARLYKGSTRHTGRQLEWLMRLDPFIQSTVLQTMRTLTDANAYLLGHEQADCEPSVRQGEGRL